MAEVIHLPGAGDYQDLPVWKEGMDLVMKIYDMTEGLTNDDPQGLVAQLRGNATIIPAKIANAHAMGACDEAFAPLAIAAGALAELQTHLATARYVKLIPTEKLDETIAPCEKLKTLIESMHEALFYAL